MIAHITVITGTKKKCVILLVIILMLGTIINLFSSPDISDETLLQNGIAELQAKLEHLQAKYLSTQEQLNFITHQFLYADDSINLQPDLRFFASNATTNMSSVLMPSIFNFMPHLLNDVNSLRPAFLQSRGRTGVSMVLGIPTVKREVQTYLMITLKNVLESMNESETQDTVIVVFVAETDLDYVAYVAKQVEVLFPKQTENGLIEVISPPASYYPDLTKLRDTLGDPHERVVWRSKQNLDFAFLMSYARVKGVFYVQLEDDILVKNHFITTMKTFALEKISSKSNWFVLDFCQLGFIGKLFKSVDLPRLVQFFYMFYNDKPVDWLLDHLISTLVCRSDKDMKHCKQAKAELWLHYKPSLFQHVGTHSSLKGKVQKLKDKQFGKIPLFYSHQNPAATVESHIKPYKQYTLTKAYRGETYFWGLLPQPGDHVKFKFNQPIYIKSYLFRSGNVEHPSDKFYNTTVEVLPESTETLNRNRNDMTDDGYIIVNKFDPLGIAQGTVDRQFGRISVLRLTVHSESDNWAILSEIFITEDDSR